MEFEDFPKKIEFWTRLGCDYLPIENYNRVRVDLLYP